MVLSYASVRPRYNWLFLDSDPTLQAYRILPAGRDLEESVLVQIICSSLWTYRRTRFFNPCPRVDDSTKAKIVDTLATWRSGTPNGKDLFDAVSQLVIEHELSGVGTLQLPTFINSNNNINEPTTDVLPSPLPHSRSPLDQCGRTDTSDTTLFSP
jgi:hypothetical protein